MNKKDNPTAPASTKNQDKNAPIAAQADAKQGGKVKPEHVLAQSGLLGAYEYIQRQYIKHGFPTANVFEHAAELVQKYEKKVKQSENKRLEALRASKDLQASPEKKEKGDEVKKPEAPKKEEPKKKDDKGSVDPKKAAPAKKDEAPKKDAPKGK